MHAGAGHQLLASEYSGKSFISVSPVSTGLIAGCTWLNDNNFSGFIDIQTHFVLCFPVSQLLLAEFVVQ